MRKRKKFFDDRVIYDTRNDCIWVGGPDYKEENKPWTFWFTNGDDCFSVLGDPSKNRLKHWVEIDRQDERTLR